MRRSCLQAWTFAVIAVWCTPTWATAPAGKIDLQPLRLVEPNAASNGIISLPQGDPLTAPLALTGAERRLFTDAEDGRFDEHTLVEAALIAGGIQDLHEVRRRLDRYANLSQELKQLCGAEVAAIEKAATIHQLLHRQLLRRYDAGATQLTSALDDGVYNCASATLLFVALAAECGLEAQAIELPGHVRAMIPVGDHRWEIEITSPNWDEAVRELDLSGAQPRSVAPAGLIAMIYYNQGIDAFHTSDFATAIAANRKALLLDSNNAKARGNLLAAVNNWALALCQTGQLEGADLLLKAGIKFDAKHAAFTHNAAYLKQLRINSR